MKSYLKIIRFGLLLNLILFFSLTVTAQLHPDFTITKEVKTTSVKNQNQTGTCWCFATLSFLETEALRMGKPSFDLSEMYIVQYAYQDKAVKYVRYQGKANFGQGGQAHDVLNQIVKNGLVPEEIYPGLQYGTNMHNHNEMSNTLEAYLKGIYDTKAQKHTTVWISSALASFNACLETYLGKAPTEFTYQGKKYTPVKFAKDMVGINPDDYVEITSYKTYPYYKQAILEIPDNWSHDLYYNVPIADLMLIMDNAINNGYSVDWDGDVSEEGFKHFEGKANLTGKDSAAIALEGIEKYRQITFDNQTTTDDHLMHITGLAKDKNGNIYYLTKNSWGDNSNSYGGFLYMSAGFVQLKTTAILVHKDAVPKEIRKKLGF